MKIGAMIHFEVWRDLGKERKQMTTVLALEPEMVVQLQEAAECEQPAGIPDAISQRLELIARYEGWHFDFIRQVLVSADVMVRAQDAIRYAERKELCDICKNTGKCEKVCIENVPCEDCEANPECRECVKSKDWKNFRWNGAAGPEEALHE